MLQLLSIAEFGLTKASTGGSRSHRERMRNLLRLNAPRLLYMRHPTAVPYPPCYPIYLYTFIHLIPLHTHRFPSRFIHVFIHRSLYYWHCISHFRYCILFRLHTDLFRALKGIEEKSDRSSGGVVGITERDEREMISRKLRERNRILFVLDNLPRSS